MHFFETYFADSIPLLGKEKMIEDYFNTRPLPLISIKVDFLRLSSSLYIHEILDFMRFSYILSVQPLQFQRQMPYNGGCSPCYGAFLWTGNELCKFSMFLGIMGPNIAYVLALGSNI